VRRLLAFAIIALATSCRSLPFPDPELHGEYGKALKKWTRQVALYSGLETRAFVRVVYLSSDFVDAQAVEISRMRAEEKDKAAETAARLHQEYRQPSFFAVVYIPDRTANDWNEPGSVWRLALNMGLGERAPEKVQRFEVPFNAELRALYPYLDEYSVGYLIKFPDPLASAPATTPAAQRFTPTEAQLIAASALGKMLFRWRLDGGPEAPSTAEEGSEQKPVTTPKP
jgi:hypothetical protein